MFTLLELILVVAFASQSFALSADIWLNGSEFGGWLLTHMSMEGNQVLLMEKGMAIFWMLATLILILWHRKNSIIFRFMKLFLLIAMTTTLVFKPLALFLDPQAAGFRWTLLAFAGRLALPWTFYYSSLRPGQMKIVARLGLALLFIGHGLQCAESYPEFMDYIIVFSNSIGAKLLNAEAAQLLALIGAIDVGMAIWALLSFKTKFPIYYMVAWGIISSSVRIFYYGSAGILPFLERSSHFTLGLALVLGESLYQKNNLGAWFESGISHKKEGVLWKEFSQSDSET